MIRDGEGIAILSIGNTGNFVEDAESNFQKKGLNIAHYDMRFVKPLDQELLHAVFQKFPKIITIEDGVLHGGFGSAILEFMADNDYKSKIIRLGIPDRFINHGTQDELYKECHYDSQALQETVYKLVNDKAAVV